MKNTNKMIFTLLGLVVVSLFLFACNDSENVSESENTETAAVTSAEASTEQIAELPSEQETDEIGTEFPVEEKGIFIWRPAEAYGTPQVLTSMASPSDYGLYTKTVSVKHEELENTVKTLSLGTFVYVNSSYALKTTVDGEYGSFYSAYDNYKSQNGAKATFLHGTDLMTYYFYTSGADSSVDTSPLTEEEILEISNKFITDYLPTGILENFSAVSADLKTDYGSATVGYVRRICGYDTDEDILIMIDENTHEVIAYNGECVGKYDTLVGKLTQEILDEAKEKLSSKLASLGLDKVVEKSYSLTTNTDGEVYMKCSFDYEYSETIDGVTERFVRADTILTKVELLSDAA